jgi:hypothetical protein
MRTGFTMIVLIVAWLSLSLLANAQSRNRGAWGNWGYNEPQNPPENYCPGCGRPWGPYGGYGMNPRGRYNEPHRMQPEQQDRAYGQGQEHGYDYGPYYPGYQPPPYEREQQKPPEGNSGSTGNDKRQ